MPPSVAFDNVYFSTDGDLQEPANRFPLPDRIKVNVEYSGRRRRRNYRSNYELDVRSYFDTTSVTSSTSERAIRKSLRDDIREIRRNQTKVAAALTAIAKSMANDE
jgi:hypothetical protein